MNMIVNTARRLEQMFPGFWSRISTKHDHYDDFGWPKELDFNHFYAMWRRNSLASAGVNKTVSKTWQDFPELWETEDTDETGLELAIRNRFNDLRIWQYMSIADQRALVGGYSALILRFRDGRPFDQPVGRAAGLEGFAGVIPAWRCQLEVAEWENDPMSDNYGFPKMYEFKEAALPGANTSKGRSIRIHPERILIWSEDGTLDCDSLLHAGYNDLLDAEKIKGAGGEGFWKNAKATPVLETDPELNIRALAQSMGVEVAEVADAVNKQVGKYNAGFDNMLMIQGMKAKTLAITLPSPEHFFGSTVQSYAASIQMPVKILLGSQTGERASTEDSAEWAETCMSRRERVCLPLIRAFVMRLEKVGVLPAKDWFYNWPDLTEATAQEKLARAKDMAGINQATQMEVFEPNEIREAAGYDEIEFEDEPNEESGDDPPSEDPPTDDPEDQE